MQTAPVAEWKRCKMADMLRLRWYATAAGLDIEAARRQPEYQSALEMLREHVKACAECRKVWE
jgi:hypothetical protein